MREDEARTMLWILFARRQTSFPSILESLLPHGGPRRRLINKLPSISKAVSQKNVAAATTFQPVEIP
jgi:hypothetical protein